MAIFKVEAIGGTSTDHCKVYDNGQQQCHLMVSIDFESIIGRPLFPDELDSLKLAAYSASTFYDQLTLPQGMTSSGTKNQFDPHPDNVRGAQDSPEPKGQVFTWDFYVSSTVANSEKLMAVVKIHDEESGQDVVYTTHSNVGDNPFESSVTVTTEPAWRVSASELEEIDPRTRASSDRHSYVWELPSPLTIFERAFEISSVWDTSVEGYLFHRDLSTGGINSVHECQVTTEQSGEFTFSDNYTVDFYYSDNQFGAGWIYIKDSSISGNLTTKDEQQKVRLLDNYGTEQSYTFDGGEEVTIR